MTDLLTAVRSLTQPTHHKVIVDNPGGPEATRVVTVTDESLLDQIDNAIRSSMGGTTSGGSDPRTRSILNIGAFNVAQSITNEVHDWARSAGSVIDKGSLGHTLEAWYVAFIGGIEDGDTKAKKLRGWAAQIVATLAPPKEMDFAQNCPACGSDCWYSQAEQASFPRPLIVYYQPADSGVVMDAKGMCRACKKVWGARELAYELEAAEQRESA